MRHHLNCGCECQDRDYWFSIEELMHNKESYKKLYDLLHVPIRQTWLDHIQKFSENTLRVIT